MAASPAKTPETPITAQETDAKAKPNGASAPVGDQAEVAAAPRARKQGPTADDVRRAFESGQYPYETRLSRRT